MNSRLLAAVILLVGTGTPVRAEIVFSGYLALDGEIKVILADSETGQKSPPLSVGGTFAGRTVTAFDAEKETVAVTRGEEARILPLKQSQAKPFTEADRVAAAHRAALREEFTARRKAQSAQMRARLKQEAEQRRADMAFLKREGRADSVSLPGKVDLQQAKDVYRAGTLKQLREAQRQLEFLRERPNASWSHEAEIKQAQTRIAEAERKLREMEK